MEIPSKISERQKFILIHVSRSRYSSVKWITKHVVSEFSDTRSPPTAVGAQITDSDRASVSRSLQRLEERGLLLRLSRSRNMDSLQLGLPVHVIPERTHTRAVVASPLGQRVGDELYRRVEDNRFSLDFSLYAWASGVQTFSQPKW